jgi:DNA-binding MurR/RpiR family transcriptional regulator
MANARTDRSTNVKPGGLQIHEQLTKAIHDRYDELSRSYLKITRFLTQNPNEVAIQSINSLAQKCGVHTSGLVRFAQAFGYKGFKELQQLFWTRVSALKKELAQHSGKGMLESAETIYIVG